MSVKPEAVIYTDGSCLGNPGPGGWASIVIVGGTTQEMSGGDPSTTNNRMELLGVINGLKSLRGPHIVKIFSDSKYITDAFNKYWLKSWKKNGWKRKDAPLKNEELWKELDALTQKHICTFVWVKGHAGNQYNERCDELAVIESRRASGEWTNEWEAQIGEDDKAPQNDSPESTEAIEALEDYIRTTNKEIIGVETPCGSLPFCEYCAGGSVQCICAKAYMAYRRDVRAQKE